jgi:hypothetical protein
MNILRKMPTVRYLIIVTTFLVFSERTVYAAGEVQSSPIPGETASNAPQSVSAPVSQGSGVQGSRGASLVFDPESKKYFIGGNAKFMLRQGQDSSIIDRIEVSVDGGEFVAYKDGISLAEEGKHTIKFRAINPVNNWSPVQFVELFLDITPPLTQTKFEEGKFFRKDNVGSVEKQEIFAALNSTLSFLAQDNLSGVAKIEYSWESETAFIPYQKPILIDKPGRRVLFFRSTDRVGNVEPTRQMTFVADGSSPSSELKISGGPLKPATVNGTSYLSTRDSVSFAVESGDAESGVREIMVSVDDRPATRYLKPIFFLQEGAHTLTYFSEDNVGNKEPAKTVSLYSVSTAPRTAATVVGKMVNKGGVNYARRDIRLKLAAEDNAVGLDRVEYRIEPSPDYAIYSEPIRFEKTGENTVVYRSVDRAGNIEAARSFKVQISETAPVTTVETSQALVVRDAITYSPSPNIVTLHTEPNGVGVNQTLVSMNDSAFGPYKGPITITAEQKVYKISFKSIDELGNEETPKTVTYHMIGSMPVVDLFVSDGINLQEQVRTDFFDRPGQNGTPANKRGVASSPAPASAAATSPAVAPVATEATASAASPVPAAAPKAPPAKAMGSKKKGPQ